MTILDKILQTKRLEVKQLLMEERVVSCETLPKRPSLFELLKKSNRLEVIIRNEARFAFERIDCGSSRSSQAGKDI